MNRKIVLVLLLPFQFAVAASTQSSDSADRPLGQLSFSSYVIENSKLLQKRKHTPYQIAFQEPVGAIDRMPASEQIPTSAPTSAPGAAGAAGAPAPGGAAANGAASGGSAWTPAQLGAPGNSMPTDSAPVAAPVPSGAPNP